KNVNNILKPIGLREDLWKDFLLAVMGKYGTKDFEKNIIKEINTCFYNWLVDEWKIFGKTLFKTKRFKIKKKV
ncbi:hypothetical protein J7M02_00435, partial [Candidatus Aerophobetes bacterium]|nr:hypothetical protein [Candidatus Aerophobetes bacterium]